jgi:BlaI family penicillinase repressor
MARKKAGKTGATGPELTDTEWTIMRVVWTAQPCAAGTVQDALQRTKHWAYSTVKTTMDRMEAKGLLRVAAIRNLQLFSASVTEAQAKRGEILKTVRRAFDGAMTPMLQFLLEQEECGEEDIVRLRTLVKSRIEKKHPCQSRKMKEGGQP